MKVFVTGAAGFIGSHLSERLIGDGHSVIGFDNLDSFYDPAIKRGNLEEISRTAREASGKFEFVEGDIIDEKLLEEALAGCDAIVHLAARAGVRPSMEQPDLYRKVNILGTSRILQAAVIHGIGRIAIASSSSVYGNREEMPLREDMITDSQVSVYGTTKKACELLAASYSLGYEMNISCLRYFTAYGPRQRPEMAIALFTRLIDEEKPIPFFGDGNSRRDYTFVDDIVEGTVLALEKAEAFHVYNVGESRTISLSELVGEIEKALGKKARIERLPNQPGDVRMTYADISAAKADLGYDPKFPLEKGIGRYVDWYRKRKG